MSEDMGRAVDTVADNVVMGHPPPRLMPPWHWLEPCAEPPDNQYLVERTPSTEGKTMIECTS